MSEVSSYQAGYDSGLREGKEAGLREGVAKADALARAAWEVWKWWHHNIRGKGRADDLPGWTVFPVRLMDSVVDQFIEDENALGDAVRAYRALLPATEKAPS